MNYKVSGEKEIPGKNRAENWVPCIETLDLTEVPPTLQMSQNFMT